MKTISIMLLLIIQTNSITWGQTNTTSYRLNALTDKSDTIRHLYLDDQLDISNFFKLYVTHPPKMELSGIRVIDCRTDSNFKNILDLLRSHSGSLETVYFGGSEEKLGPDEFLKVIENLNTGHIKKFFWINQKTLTINSKLADARVKKKEDLRNLEIINRIKNCKEFLNNLESLSLKNTPFNMSASFLTKTDWPKLNHLELSGTGISSTFLDSLMLHKDSFQELRSLNMDYVELDPVSVKNGAFKNLKEFSCFVPDANETDSKNLFSKSGTDFFKNIERIHVPVVVINSASYSSKDITSDFAFKFSFKKKLGGNNIVDSTTFFSKMLNLKNPGYFFCSTDQSKIKTSSIVARAFSLETHFFSETTDIDSFIISFPNKDKLSVVLASPLFGEQEVVNHAEILSSLRTGDVFLVNTRIRPDQLLTVRDHFDTRIHRITIEYPSENPAWWSNPFLQHYNLHQLNIPKLNVPKFK
ncbi:hypothetical protein JNM05_00465 [bacterium]|nr:hypothetical protein [bacterium]